MYTWLLKNLKELLELKQMEQAKIHTKRKASKNIGAHGTYNTNIRIKFKTAVGKSKVCHYNDVHMLASSYVLYLLHK